MAQQLLTVRFAVSPSVALLLVTSAAPVEAQPFIAPGDPAYRHYLALLHDYELVSASSVTWPVSRSNLDHALVGVDRQILTAEQQAAFDALQSGTGYDDSLSWQFKSTAFVGKDPISIRSFEGTPRADSGLTFNAAKSAGRLSVNIAANALINPLDHDKFNLDGSYVSLKFGNWLASAGWQERWWGPGNTSSLILSTNARPSPGVALQRQYSQPFESRWLAWVGPWSLTTFMNLLDDDRAVNDALLWGARVDFTPVPGLQIGLSRTAQWCGSGRSCSLKTFSDVLLGNDNRGVNVSFEDEPGNQLAGIDLRWRLPREIPVALYLQWIGEDTRQGGPEIGSWLRLAGVEAWGTVGNTSYRVFVEWADTVCREGGAGFSDVKPNCSYRHPIYASGYTYQQHSMGHSADGDSRVFSLGATLVQSADYYWNIGIRHMDINRVGAPDAAHTVSASLLKITDITLSVKREFSFGRLAFGLALSDESSTVAGGGTETSAYLKWSSS